tara:strand:+ start:890 stop:1456 length:567 start_codon:yes stop_codon:yes gene_type:complete
MFYKLVSNINGVRRSWNCCNEVRALGSEDTIIKIKRHALVYTTDEWTKPMIENSGLFIFDSIKHALKMNENTFTVPDEEPELGEIVELWQIGCINPRRVERICAMRGDYDEFWTNPRALGNWCRPMDRIAPTSRVFLNAAKIKILQMNYASGFPVRSYESPEGSFVCEALKLGKLLGSVTGNGELINA